MAREEAINRLNRIAGKAVHTPGEMPFVMSIDDGIAVRMAIEVLQQSDHIADGGKKDDHLREVTKMVDTISRQAAIDVLDVLCQEHRYKIPGKRETYSQYNEARQDALDRAENAIGNLPSAQPEIIRCKECKYRRADTLYSYCEKLYRMGVLDIYCYMTSDDDFCSMAERR